MAGPIRLGDLLVEKKVITEEQLNSALKSQKKSGLKLGRELIVEGFLTEESLVDFLSQQLDIKKVNLGDYELKIEVSRKLPELQSRRHNCLVIKEDENHFEVVMADPTDIYAYDDLARSLKKPFVVSIAALDEIRLAIDSVFRRSSEMQGLAEELQQEFGSPPGDEEDLVG
ncbi:MAG: MSHA biogenesis protein MshE, partial [Gammaproteobacteria bacterium]|nr:MSHA biogenesis protein MshE [Gammaproteobacteria bacterium]